MKTASIYDENQVSTYSVWKELNNIFCKARISLNKLVIESADAAETVAVILLVGTLFSLAINRMAEATNITSYYSASILQSTATLWGILISY